MNTWKTDWAESQKRYENWWQGKGLILTMWEHLTKAGAPYADVSEPPKATDLNQFWFDPEWRADYLHWQMSRNSYKADIIPVANTQLGPGSLASILGSIVEGGEDTIWIKHRDDFGDEIAFDENHPWLNAHLDLLRAVKKRAQGHYYVGIPDIMEGLDVIANLRGTENVLMDMVLRPEVLEAQAQAVNDIYFKVYDQIYDIVNEGGESAFCYFSIWGPGKVAKLQSDISIMFSEDDYVKFEQPYLRKQCQYLDYSLYHLDGVGAVRHLDAILDIKELNAIQWTPGVGEPQGGDPKWYDLYKRIKAGGKSVQANWVTLDELRPLLDAVGPDGMHISMDFKCEAEIDQALKIVEAYR
ncbi:hypothetical protein LJB87_01805 [Alistipes sp. OttesenSCG-928-L06]|nr:hypothetical protein [Alistipes sp. OttesenSCG-928-L06]